eukprot:s1173_g23.t1
MNKANQGGIAIFGAQVVAAAGYRGCFVGTFIILFIRMLIYLTFTLRKGTIYRGGYLRALEAQQLSEAAQPESSPTNDDLTSVENIKGYDDTDQDGLHCECPLQYFEGVTDVPAGRSACPGISKTFGERGGAVAGTFACPAFVRCLGRKASFPARLQTVRSFTPPQQVLVPKKQRQKDSKPLMSGGTAGFMNHLKLRGGHPRCCEMWSGSNPAQREEHRVCSQGENAMGKSVFVRVRAHFGRLKLWKD